MMRSPSTAMDIVLSAFMRYRTFNWTHQFYCCGEEQPQPFSRMTCGSWLLTLMEACGEKWATVLWTGEKMGITFGIFCSSWLCATLYNCIISIK